MSFVHATTALRTIGPVARTHELRARGVTQREIARAAATGEIRRVRQGVYALADASDAMIHAAEHGGAPACQEAGRLYRLWVLDTGNEKNAPFHLWLGTAGDRRPCGRRGCSDVTVHWDAGTVTLGRLPPVENVLLQIAVCAGEEAFFVALESGLRQSRLSTRALDWLGWRLPPSMRRLLEFARSDADSGLESLVRLRLHRVGIAVRTQVQIDGVGEVDFVIGDRLIVEADGKENHDDMEKAREGGSRRHKDLLRDARAAALGYETLRFDYAMIVHDWPTVETAILAKIAAGAHLRA